MPGVKLSTSSRDGRVVVALRGHLDVSGAAETGAAITAAVPSQYLVVGLPALDFTGAGQLEAALNSRVTIEQGNGKLAGRYGTSMGYAFTMPRNHPRNAGQHLADVARAIVSGATAEFRPRHGTSRIASAREQREELCCDPAGTAASAVNCRPRCGGPARQRKTPSPRRAIARCRPMAREIRPTGPPLRS